VNDEEDKCPEESGPASNNGCPEIKQEVVEKVNMAAKEIYFATGSDKLLDKSAPALDAVLLTLQTYKSAKMNIEGHTDNTGRAESNMTLSEKRAASVKNYLISKGVAPERLFSKGYGQTNPIADNKTSAGRAKNRRVEIKLSY
jgi:outer membrane protein OmpA-like peptidoglycan-associated protein